MAETKNDANAALDAFVETYAIKYDKAVSCLVKSAGCWINVIGAQWLPAHCVRQSLCRSLL
jgi:hypothetical protein